jgi:hypothetical protein
MHVRIVNGQPQAYTLTQLRRDNPAVSFPSTISPETLAEYGVFPVTALARPGFDERTQRLQQSEFYQVDGRWQVHWVVVDLPPRVPERVTMRQARLALLGADLLDAVEPAIAAIPDPVQRRAAEIAWEYSTEVRRDDGLIAAIAGKLGLTDAQIDELFTAGSAL